MNFKKLPLFLIFLLFFFILAEGSASPAGRIVFIRDGNVWLSSVDRVNAKPLTFSKNNRHPSISPDGKQIVFTSGHDSKTGFGKLYFMTSEC